jgi:hypothetical protein
MTAPQRLCALGALALMLLVAGVRPAYAILTVDVSPQTTTAGAVVTVFGNTTCEIVTIDFGDGTSGGPFFVRDYSTTHVYTQPAPAPPGVYVITARGSTCGPGIPLETSTVSVFVTGDDAPTPPPPPPPDGASTLLINRLGLRFENDRPEIRVRQDQRGVQVYADVRYTGTGLLQGYWEVDGITWGFVNRHLVFGNVVTIASPDAPGLPTVTPGVHRVRLILTQPQIASIPVAVYFVGLDEVPTLEPLRLLSPPPAAHLTYEKYEFRWSALAKAASYQVTFFEAEGTQPIFSALAKETSYVLTERALGDRFGPGQRYEWQVTALDAAGETLAQTLRAVFEFDPLEEFVAGQVVVVTEFSMSGTQTLARLRTKYRLRELQTHALRSVNLQMTVFETMDNVTSVARDIARETGVVLAHPNALLRTLGDAQSSLQGTHELLKLDALHQRARGHGVSVAVIDTGIDATHPDLKDRVTLQRSFASGEPVAEIHGTAVAGLIAASRNDTGIVGIAPEARLLALRACRQVRPDHPEATCTAADTARALDTALLERARVVNMSFGSAQPVPLIARLIDKGKASGIWFVAPVGNASWQRAVAFPASHAGVIAVAGNDENGTAYPNAQLYRVSRVVAPARSLFSTVPGGRYNFLDGTSLSSAIVTGLIAVALGQRTLTPAELPARAGDMCSWSEQLLKISFCAQAAVHNLSTDSGEHR